MSLSFLDPCPNLPFLDASPALPEPCSAPYKRPANDHGYNGAQQRKPPTWPFRAPQSQFTLPFSSIFSAMEPSEPLPADIAMRLQTTATATANSTANSTADNEASPEQPAEQYQTGVRFILLTAGLILSIFLAALDSSILATAIPRITDEFHTVKDVGWYSAAYWVSNASLLSTWGRAVSLKSMSPCGRASTS